MSDESAVDTAVRRLALALDALDAAVERRTQADQSEAALAAQVQALGTDRTRLAAALDGEAARSRRLEETNREIAGRLDAAVISIQSVLAAHGEAPPPQEQPQADQEPQAETQDAPQEADEAEEAEAADEEAEQDAEEDEEDQEEDEDQEAEEEQQKAS
jgi:hypothetical protein